MESIKKLLKIGFGPSSSHTIGPRSAAEQFKSRNENAAAYRVTLYGSLAATGSGHLTDTAIKQVFSPKQIDIKWEPKIFLPFHPNGMKFEAFESNGNISESWTVYSIGGGSISDGTIQKEEIKPIYGHSNLIDILNYIKKNGMTYWEYVEDAEDDDIWEYLKEVWTVMENAIERGIEEEGTLPGILKLPRKASSYYTKAKSYSGGLRRRALAFSFALAVAEENAAGGQIVTAPTCGSCGVLPSVLYLQRHYFDFSEKRILKALATAGLVGNIVKKNASISGAEVGCQGEIGTACAMASAAACQIFGGTPSQIEYAAEMGLEHHLGLTCDPIAGLVQVPCIERNAYAAGRALDSATYSVMSDGRHIVSFDRIVKTMNDTGHDLPSIYKETSEGGLADIMRIEYPQ